MNRAQILTIVILVVMVALFLWEKWRFDIVALMALLASVAAGIVPANKAFSGFANPVLPLIGAALIVSAAIGQSGAIEILVRRLHPLMKSRDLQVGVLVGCVVILSAFVKNIGALAIFIPAAVQVARRANRSPSEFLMPLSFASLLGGSATLVGTSPNILAASVRQQLTGQPFHMFDFTPVGAGIAVLGALFLMFGWRLIPRGLRGSAGEAAFRIEDYTSEVRVLPGSPYIGQTVREVEQHSGGEIAITAIIRDSIGRAVPSGGWRIYEDDVLVIEADSQALELVARDGKLELVGGEEPPATAARRRSKPKEDAEGRGRDRSRTAIEGGRRPKPPTKTQKAKEQDNEDAARRSADRRRGGGRRALADDRPIGRDAAAARAAWRQRAGDQPQRPAHERPPAPRPVPARRRGRAAGRFRAYQRYPRPARLPAARRA